MGHALAGYPVERLGTIPVRDDPGSPFPGDDTGSPFSDNDSRDRFYGYEYGVADDSPENGLNLATK